MKILYIGTFLEKKGRTPAPNEIISYELEKAFEIQRCSDRNQPLLRLAHMLFCTLKSGVQRNTVVIIDVFSSKAFWYTYLVSGLSRLLKLPVILVLHGGNLLNRFKRNERESRRLLQKADAVVSPSSFFKHTAGKMFGIDIQVIGNPVNMKVYPLKQKNFQTPHLLWVRSFHELYNPLMAVELCDMLKETYPDFSLTMIGPDKDGSMKKVRNRALEIGLSDQIHTPGLMSKEDWIKASEKCNVFINTTHFDNTPVSVIEALALGLPVISTNVGGLPYLLKDETNALLVDDNDTLAMKQSVLRLMNEPELRERLIHQGRILAEEMDIETVGAAWIKLINEVVS